jgi:hypothetical protein
VIEDHLDSSARSQAPVLDRDEAAAKAQWLTQQGQPPGREVILHELASQRPELERAGHGASATSRREREEVLAGLGTSRRGHAACAARPFWRG